MPQPIPITTAERASRRVLVVDDESCVRGLLRRWLADAGYAHCEARDPDEAFERLREQHVDALTLDVRMPLGSGLDIVHRVAREYPHVAILMVTAVDDARHAIAALTQGACDYLIKPLDREMFLGCLRRALAVRQRTIAESPVRRPLAKPAGAPSDMPAPRLRPVSAKTAGGPNFAARPPLTSAQETT